jgi:hypothetical protein
MWSKFTVSVPDATDQDLFALDPFQIRVSSSKDSHSDLFWKHLSESEWFAGVEANAQFVPQSESTDPHGPFAGSRDSAPRNAQSPPWSALVANCCVEGGRGVRCGKLQV